VTRDGGGQLQSIVNYRGFRIIAVSVIPISKQTIIYGSHDGGKTVHADYEAFNVRLNRIFAGFNLKVRTLRAPYSVTEAAGLPKAYLPPPPPPPPPSAATGTSGQGLRASSLRRHRRALGHGNVHPSSISPLYSALAWSFVLCWLVIALTYRATHT
jgi:hypothetical protein